MECDKMSSDAGKHAGPFEWRSEAIEGFRLGVCRGCGTMVFKAEEESEIEEGEEARE